MIFFKKIKKGFSYNIKKVELFFFPLLVFFLFLSKSTFADNKLLMITADYCIYCQIWEKEIGKIYPKTDISKSFPLERIDLDEYLFDNDINEANNYKTKITPTFVFYRGNNEIGRITGYSSAEMFWWQVDEILDRN